MRQQMKLHRPQQIMLAFCGCGITRTFFSLSSQDPICSYGSVKDVDASIRCVPNIVINGRGVKLALAKCFEFAKWSPSRLLG